MDKKISVIVPVYKVENYIRKCLNSIINQSYKNIEIILVDDGSPDNSGVICDEYAKVDDRIKVIHKENGGVSSARNTGIDNASGEYVAFVDSDDYIAPDMYEKLYEEAENNNFDVVECNYIEVYDDGKTKEWFLKNKEFNNYQKMICGICDCYIAGFVLNKLYKRELIGNIRFRENLTIAEDVLFNIECFKRAKAIKVLDEALYFYYQRDNSVSHLKISDGHFKEFEVFDIMRQESTDKSTRKSVEFWYICRCIEVFENILKTGKFEEKTEETRRRILGFKWKIFFHKSFKSNVCVRRFTMKRRLYVFILWLCPSVIYNRTMKQRGIK